MEFGLWSRPMPPASMQPWVLAVKGCQRQKCRTGRHPIRLTQRSRGNVCLPCRTMLPRSTWSCKQATLAAQDTSDMHRGDWLHDFHRSSSLVPLHDVCTCGVKAIDNVFPRVLSIFPGAKSAGYKLSVVIPKTSREFFSTWKHFLYSSVHLAGTVLQPPRLLQDLKQVTTPKSSLSRWAWKCLKRSRRPPTVWLA